MPVLPITPWHGQIPLVQLQRVKNWHSAHPDAHPVEQQVWDAVITMWVMGWLSWLPAWIFGATWVYPLCIFGLLAPKIYVRLRALAQKRGSLRCEWLQLLN